MTDFARFPARVRFADGRLMKKAAVVVRGDSARVAELAAGGVREESREHIASVETNPDRTTTVTFEDGSTWRIGKGEGCSCGSPLKTWYSQALRAGG